MANERRLIDREALLEDIEAAMAHGGMGVVVAGTLKRYVKRQPTVDAVEVVRCRDCYFAHRVDGPREKYSCAKGSYFTPWFNGDDFCSRGERRCE